MTQRKVVPKVIKNEILATVKSGEKVAELARQYGISDKSIYTWLHQDTGDQVVSIIQYNVTFRWACLTAKKIKVEFNATKL